MIRMGFSLVAAVICTTTPAFATSVAHPVPQASSQGIQVITPPRLPRHQPYTPPPSARNYPSQSTAPVGQTQIQPASKRLYPPTPPVGYWVNHQYYDTRSPMGYPYCKEGLFGRITNKPCRIRHHPNGSFFDKY